MTQSNDNVANSLANSELPSRQAANRKPHEKGGTQSVPFGIFAVLLINLSFCEFA